MRGLLRTLLALALLAVVAGAGSLYVSGRRSVRAAHDRKQGAVDPRGIDETGRTPAEGEAVHKALRAGLRTATDDDATDSDARRELENLYADYHPFFVRGDLDGDGRLDFAQGFVEKRNGGLWFDVAVFFGREGGTFSEPVFVEKAISLAAGDLSIERSILVLTPDVAREDVRRWRWEPSEGRFVDADAMPPKEAPDADEPDTTPDDKPRARA